MFLLIFSAVVFFAPEMGGFFLEYNNFLPAYTLVAQACTLLYFSFFLLMPWWSAAGRFKAVPTRVTFTPH
jgi:ubiquinol-cytochrome c reductase cytochrome b subunit